MNIGVFGDSFSDMNNVFAVIKENESWMRYLGDYTNSEVTCFGRSGTSIWYSFEKFKEHYKKYTHIVFCQTSPHRIPHLYNKFVGFNFIKNIDYINSIGHLSLSDKDVLANIVKVYYSHLHNEELDIFLAQQVFDQVNLLCKKENIKLITILPFEDLKFQKKYIIDVSNRTGDCLLGLLSIASAEYSLSSDTNATLIYDKRYCHLTKENNQILANIIKTSFESLSRRVFNFDSIDSEDYKMFLFDKKISDRYFK